MTELSSTDVKIQMASQRREEEALPSLLIEVPSRTIAGFDCVGLDEQQDKDADDTQTPYSLSFSMPASPSGFHSSQCMTASDPKPVGQVEVQYEPPLPLKQMRFHSQPILRASQLINGGAQRVDSARDKRFDPFKTFSGRLERQLSNLRGRQLHPMDLESQDSNISEEETDQVPGTDRYFDALEGPELDTLRASEIPVVPNDEQWPFLLRFPISAFGMVLGVSSQGILWKTLAWAPPTAFLHVSLLVPHVLWYISLALMALVSSIYFLKVVFYFEAVRREFYHPIRANFFFAPWIACLFLVQGSPRDMAKIHPGAWYAIMAPIFCLELKIYGQWMSGGQRRLSKVANPSNHLSIVGNFVGALLGAKMGLREGPIFFFAVGLAHYSVLFVTLYQRLPTNETLPKELHPVFFLFVAAPSVASMAWAKINGEFNNGARVAFFIALFLYMSLAVRINFFRGFRFSLAWWAYTFPMTGASIATITYATEVNNVLTRTLSIGLSGVATVTVAGLLVTTMLHAFVFKDLFPNDVSIAITQRKPKFSKMLAHLRSSSSDMKELVVSMSKSPNSDSDESAAGSRETHLSVPKGNAEP